MSADGPSVRRSVASRRVVAVRPGHHLELPDDVVTEEPMEIRLGGGGEEPGGVGVTMRTPGHDFELAVGFLVSEGLILPGDRIETVRYCELPADGAQRFNVVTVRLDRPVDLDGHQRRFTVSSACGVCGSSTVEELQARCRPVAGGPPVPASVLLGLPERLRRHQRIFDRTGGLHAAGLFGSDGSLIEVREDVGRHNAVDKLVGWARLAGRIPLAGAVLVVSGRAGFEIVQKAAVAGVPVVVAVSAPTSLAVETAERLGVTLAGFVRGDRANIYSWPSGVDVDA